MRDDAGNPVGEPYVGTDSIARDRYGNAVALVAEAGPIGVQVDIIQSASGDGVDIDGVTLQDGGIHTAGALHTDQIFEETVNEGVTVETVLIKDGNVTTGGDIQAAGGGHVSAGGGMGTNTISEFTGGSGVTVDGVLLKDGEVRAQAEGILDTGVFASTEQVGTGGAQLIPHGLSSTPSLAWCTVTNGHNGAGAAGDLCPSVSGVGIDATNLTVLVTAGAEFRLYAIL